MKQKPFKTMEELLQALKHLGTTTQPCGTCPMCEEGRPERCRNPEEKQ